MADHTNKPVFLKKRHLDYLWWICDICTSYSAAKKEAFVIQKNRPRLLLPIKGYLEEETVTFLSKCGLEVIRNSPRQYLGYIQSVPDLEIIFQRAADIPLQLENGYAVLGITGFDILAEYSKRVSINTGKNYNHLIVLEQNLGYGRTHLVMAVPEDWTTVQTCADLQFLAEHYQIDPGRALRIAAKYPLLTEQFLHQKNIPNYNIVTLHGAIEAAPLIGAADLIVELTATGATLQENRLKVLEDGLVLEAHACLIANAQLLYHSKHILDLVTLIREFVKT
jgi:ATP phosphoribosyltransferase